MPDAGQDLRPERIELMLEAMELMTYEAVGLGEEELALGPDFLARAASRLPLVCSNLRLGAGRDGLIPPVRMFERDGRTIAVAAYVDPLLYYETPGALDLSPDSLLVVDPIQSLRPIVADLRTRADLVVVLAHGSLDQVREWIPEVPGVDVVLQGHEPGMSEGLSQVGDTYLILAGPRSRKIGQLALTLDGDGRRVRANYRLFDLKKARGFADRRVEDLVEEFETRYGIE